MTESSRQIFWNIDSRSFLHAWGMLLVLSLLAALLIRVLCWRRGRSSEAPLEHRSSPWELIRTLVTFKGIHLGHFPLLMHRCILFGFVLLGVGTLLVALQTHLGVRLLHGGFYRYFELGVDLAGLLLLAGLSMAAYKRYIKRAERLENRIGDAAVLALLALIVASGFLVKGLRLAATQDPWAWSPVGFLVAHAWGALLTPAQARSVHFVAWHGHAALALGFLTLAPWTKLTHILALPAYLRLRRPLKGRLAPRGAIDQGTATLSDLPLEAHLEADACMQCGRCRKQCPIQADGIPFSPESMLRGRRGLLHAGAWRRPLLGSVIGEDALWSCTACRACEERCPMGGEHVERIVDIRRSAVSLGALPESVAGRFRESVASRRELPGALVAGQDPDTLYLWPGCRAADERGSGILQALLRLLEHAGIPVLVLEPPRCCSGSERLLGNEALFQEALQANMEYLAPIKGARIVTFCPHCYTTLKGGYPAMNEGDRPLVGLALRPPRAPHVVSGPSPDTTSAFGDDFTLLHHTQVLEDLQARGLLPSADGLARRVTYHDPCFLGRYHGEYDAVRRLLGGIPGVTLLEMKQSRKKSLCCGSGGGAVMTGSAAANARKRVRQGIGSGAELLVTSCPYCRESLRGASRDPREGGILVEDIAELLVRGCAR